MLYQIPQAADTVLISVNPKAGRTSPMIRATELGRLLEKKGFRAEILTDLSVVTQRANQLFEESKLRVLIGVGGDGTAAELVNRTSVGVPVTLLPAGTANLIAKYLSLPFNPQKAADMIEQGWLGTFDAGRANGRLFLVMISAGIDADIVHKVHAAREENYRKGGKKGAHISYLSYLRPIFSSIFSYAFPNINVSVAEPDSKTVTKFPLATCISSEEDLGQNISEKSKEKSDERLVTGKWAFVFNLPKYGWGLPLVPGCKGNDQRLDFCIFRRGTTIASVINVLFAQLGASHRFLPNAQLGTGTNFLLSSAIDSCERNSCEQKPCDQEASSQKIPYQLDGDPGGFLPVQIEMVPNRFTVLAPKKILKKRLGDFHGE